MQKLEPIFSRQEQAVVYLFSRYWEEIPEFKAKRIRRIHTHFPDFAIVNADGKEESIEFEYGLSAFCSHLGGRGKFLRKLHRNGIRCLYIVYWDENDDEIELHRKIKATGFKGEVKFICLKDYFNARVFKNQRSEPWQAAWEFTKNRRSPPGAYPFERIKSAFSKLGSSVKSLPPNKNLYRVMGFDKEGADFIECDHWETIHFFTTTTHFAEDQIPRKLFVKPSGCKYFNGYFDIRIAFEVIKASKLVKQFFTDYYFYDYDHDYMQSNGKVKCFVCNFKRLKYKQGKDIYEFLKGKHYSLGVQSSIVIGEEGHIDKIDAIVAMQDGSPRQNRKSFARQ